MQLEQPEAEGNHTCHKQFSFDIHLPDPDVDMYLEEVTNTPPEKTSDNSKDRQKWICKDYSLDPEPPEATPSAAPEPSQTGKMSKATQTNKELAPQTGKTPTSRTGETPTPQTSKTLAPQTSKTPVT